MHNPKQHVSDIRLSLLFWSNVIAIPLVSYLGRRLQHWFEDSIGKDKLGWLIASLLLITAAVYIARFVKNWKGLWWRLAIVGILLIAIFLYVPITEERIHFILFGLLGYLSVMLFGLPRSILICALLSVGDEIFQWILPDRVGDMHDVMVNLIASTIGIVLASIDRRYR